MEQITTLNIITLIIAIYGAILSTIITIQKIKSNKRNIAVSCIHKEQSINKDGEVYNIIVALKAVNMGKRPVNLEFCGFITSKKKFIPSQLNLPKLLEDGESVIVPFNMQTIREKLDELQPEGFIKKAYFKDAEGKFYFTNKFPKTMTKEKIAVNRNIFLQ